MVAFAGSGRLYDQVGRGAISLDGEPDPRPGAGSPPRAPEAEEEIRQMLEAKSARREARGEPPLDVDAEVAALRIPRPP